MFFGSPVQKESAKAPLGERKLPTDGLANEGRQIGQVSGGAGLETIRAHVVRTDPLQTHRREAFGFRPR